MPADVITDVLIFAGTLEGRTVAEYACAHGITVYVCVATEYGGSLLSGAPGMTVSDRRLSAKEMERLMAEENPRLVIDSTHPYAAEVTKNIRAACERAGKPYLRLLRDSQAGAEKNGCEVHYADSVADAAAFLNTVEGNILAATGSKELARYTVIDGYRERVYARVLSLPQVVKDCAALGFSGAHLICMQGPFSMEMNLAMLRQVNAKWLVTKESGATGGFAEKCEAARRAGAGLVVVGRPLSEEGLSLGECRRYLAREFGIRARQKVTLVSVGMGGAGTMTEAARECLGRADVVIGAKRLAGASAGRGQAVYEEYDPEKIRAFLERHPEYERAAIVLSGDAGFYSNAKRLIGALPEKPEVICGISSPVYLMSRLGLPWEDVRLVSVHGREQNLIEEIARSPKVFALLGQESRAGDVCRKLTEYGLGAVKVVIGERLSYPEERIRSGTAAELAGCEADSLSVLYAENPDCRNELGGIGDAEFVRGQTPMTKEEVRTVSVSRLRLTEDAVCYDVGAGTGSVSVEMALKAVRGRVYAVERDGEAAALIEANRQRFAADNLTVVRGNAPEAFASLPAPTHAFVGGSSGNLREILTALLDKNPRVRIVVNAVSLETLGKTLACARELPVTEPEVTQLAVSRAKKAGNYHLMIGQNPVYIISFCGGAEK